GPATEFFPSQVAGMLADEEVRLATLDPEHELGGAEIAVVNPHLSFPDQLQRRANQGPLLGMAVLTGNDVRHQVALRVVHDQRLPRQRRGRLPAQHLEATLRGRQVVAVQDLYTVSGDRRRQFGPQFRDDSGEASRRIAYEGRGEGEFGALELAVDGDEGGADLALGLGVGR